MTVMLGFQLGVLPNGANLTVGRKHAPSWSDIEQKITALQVDGGVISLEEEQNGKKVRIDATCENGRYFITYAAFGRGYEEVYNFVDPNSSGDPHRLTDVLGDLWSEAIVCTDFSHVFRYFKEFWETGKVSLEHFS